MLAHNNPSNTVYMWTSYLPCWIEVESPIPALARSRRICLRSTGRSCCLRTCASRAQAFRERQLQARSGQRQERKPRDRHIEALHGIQTGLCVPPRLCAANAAAEHANRTKKVLASTPRSSPIQQYLSA